MRPAAPPARALRPGAHRGLSLSLSLCLSLAGAGCAASPPAAHGLTVARSEGKITPVDVRDEDFAASLHRVLRDGTPSEARLGLLAGVVRRQLAHSAQRFASGHDGRATDGVLGAFYLLRAGEGRAEMVDATGEKALAGAIARVSVRGDEGRAGVFMRMRAAALPAGTPARAELDDHLAALDQWILDTSTGGPMQKLGSAERTAVSRALVDPTGDALDTAGGLVGEWIDHGIRANAAFQEAFQRSGQRPDRDELGETSRAIETGGATMAALYLRQGNARAALEHIEKTEARRVTQPLFYARIRAAAVSDSAKDWLGLAAWFAHPEVDADQDDPVDPEARLGALWGASLEAYRRDPSLVEASLLLGHSMVRLGMGEAVPLVVGEGIAANPSPQAFAAGLDLVLAAIADSADSDDVDGARRTYQAAGPLLALGDTPALRGQTDPSVARLRFVMSEIEVRAGNLGGARSLLQSAVQAEPSTSAYTTLAMVERQAGDVTAALADVDRALKAPDARGALADTAEANVLAFELYRDTGLPDRAKTALDAALSAVLAARQQKVDAVAKTRAERLLGRILDGYGDAKGAARALDRALSSAGGDRPSLGAAMLDAIGRALLRRDLPSAQAALKRGLDGEVGEDDLVYGGLWVLLLERDLKVPIDAAAERALHAAGGHPSWTGKLAAWANGKLSDADLTTAAHGESQQVEARFYTAMALKVTGDPGAEQRLRVVAQSPVIDLLEVQLAREMLAPRVRTSLPGNVQLP